MAPPATFFACDGVPIASGASRVWIEYLRDAVARDPLYSAAWTMRGKSLTELEHLQEALDAYRQGIEAARQKGDRQAEKEMTVFARRLEKKGGKA